MDKAFFITGTDTNVGKTVVHIGKLTHPGFGVFMQH
jgi:dethiobiotin synthetase